MVAALFNKFEFLWQKMVRDKERRHFIVFTIVGAAAISMDMGTYYFLINFLPKAAAKTMSFFCGGVIAYFFNKYWTFQQAESSGAEVGRFVLANTAALVLNVSTNQGMLILWPTKVLLALMIATAVTFVFSFFIFKFWVFKSP
jgi:putative flippase GtrA